MGCDKNPQSQQEILNYIQDPKNKLCFEKLNKDYKIKISFWPKQLVDIPSMKTDTAYQEIIFFRVDFSLTEQNTANRELVNSIKQKFSFHTEDILIIKQGGVFLNVYSSNFMPFYGYSPNDVLLFSIKMNKRHLNDITIIFDFGEPNFTYEEFTFSQKRIIKINKMYHEI
jgi:hypothetical protein